MNDNLKEEIIELIKNDIKTNLNNINDEELNHLSNNLFELCLLKINNIDDQTIANKIMCMNNLFIKEMTKKNIEISSKNFNVESNFYKKLENKYINIIKERL